MSAPAGRLPWALASAAFAALTAVSAKAGPADVDADYATLVRTVLVALLLGVLVAAAGKWRDPFTPPGRAAAALGERPAGRDWAGIALAGAGVLVLALRR